MGTAVALTIAALLGAAAIVAPVARVRALAMLAALVLTPVLLVSHVADSDQLSPLTNHPAAAAGAGRDRRGDGAGFAGGVARDVGAVARLPASR